MAYTLPPLSLYIHFPWCASKCPYCDFNSHTQTQKYSEREYISALKKDLKQTSGQIFGRPIHSIFIGGGTPSLCSEQGISSILESAYQYLTLESGCEITLEANPNSSDAEKFISFRQSGINRLSIGIQSLNARHLLQLGRAHTPDDALNAIDAANKAGFQVLNLDLMYALPEQTLTEAADDLQQVMALAPQHISHYQLTLEPHTPFYHQPPALPDHDTTWDMQNTCQKLLKAHGYEQYEVSAYAQNGYRCRHNLNYWKFGDYLAIGAGAHAKITDPAGNIKREARILAPNAYIEGKDRGRFIETSQTLDNNDKGIEFMLNALRLSDGFSIELLEQRTGQPLHTFHGILKQAEQDNLLQIRDHCVIPTDFGKRHLNEVIMRFL